MHPSQLSSVLCTNAQNHELIGRIPCFGRTIFLLLRVFFYLFYFMHVYGLYTDIFFLST